MYVGTYALLSPFRSRGAAWSVLVLGGLVTLGSVLFLALHVPGEIARDRDRRATPICGPDTPTGTDCVSHLPAVLTEILPGSDSAKRPEKAVLTRDDGQRHTVALREGPVRLGFLSDLSVTGHARPGDRVTAEVRDRRVWAITDEAGRRQKTWSAPANDPADHVLAGLAAGTVGALTAAGCALLLRTSGRDGVPTDRRPRYLLRCAIAAGVTSFLFGVPAMRHDPSVPWTVLVWLGSLVPVAAFTLPLWRRGGRLPDSRIPLWPTTPTAEPPRDRPRGPA
ncbi:hypothetical protein ACN20G_28455 (plasmid) [Streptomyces sp. BI20]|uniref:hypothetical protein n=1 Tax=Streptomyces sp. BI20 TaxID=3403460 RepID=UPI003C74B147